MEPLVTGSVHLSRCLKVCPCCDMCHYFIPFYWQIIFQSVNRPQSFTHCQVAGHLGCFHFSVSRHDTATTLHVWVFVWTCASSSLGRLTLLSIFSWSSLHSQADRWWGRSITKATPAPHGWHWLQFVTLLMVFEWITWWRWCLPYKVILFLFSAILWGSTLKCCKYLHLSSDF
jgi:hypothetical protein